MVDVADEQMYERIPPAMVKLNKQFDWFAIHVLPIVARIGLFRLMVTFDRLPLAAGLFKKLLPDMQAAAKAVYAQTKFWRVLGQESADFPVSLKQIKPVSYTHLTLPTICSV